MTSCAQRSRGTAMKTIKVNEALAMEYRNFLTLTDEEIKRLMTDMFDAKKVTCVKRSIRWDEITCKVYTEWEGDKDAGEDDFVVVDEITLKDPFVYESQAILGGSMPIKACDFTLLKQFCVSKGIYPEWYKNNPYTNK